MSARLKELILKAQQGDEGAMEHLLKHFRPAILRYSRCMGYDHNDAAQDLREVLIWTIKNYKIFLRLKKLVT